MKLQDLFNDRGVSPVIGVVLMVAITVILAATVGVLLVQFGNNAVPEGNAGPVGSVSFDLAGTDQVTITISQLNKETTMGEVKVQGDVDSTGDWYAITSAKSDGSGTDLSAGATLTLTLAGTPSSSNPQTVTVTYIDSNTGDSKVIGKRTFK